MNKHLRATEAAHMLAAAFLGEGRQVIDATCGNGLDTLFLAERVGKSGRVYAFDIQKEAIEETRRLLSENGLLDRVRLINDSHVNFSRYIEGPVDGIVYNLGYLPGGEKSITTQTSSTLSSLREGMKLLADGGFMWVVAYPGHAGGENEAAEVEEFLSALPSPPWHVLSYERLNSRKPSPYLIFINRS